MTEYIKRIANKVYRDNGTFLGLVIKDDTWNDERFCVDEKYKVGLSKGDLKDIAKIIR